MKKKSEIPSVQAGLSKERNCRHAKYPGLLRLWHCRDGSPMGSGPDGEPWAVEWHPGGKGESRHVHFRNQREALACFRGLGKGQPDRWGMFEFPEKKPRKKKQDVAQKETPPPPGGGEVAPPAETPKNELAIYRGMPLTPAFKEAFTTDEIIAKIKQMMDAERPIYATVDGTQSVVGHEPDWQTQREALKALLNYREGLPVKRVEEIRTNVVSAADIERKIVTSPAYCDALQKLIDHAREQQKRRLKTVMTARVVEREETEDLHEGE